MQAFSGGSHHDEHRARGGWTGHGLKNGFSDEAVKRSADILHQCRAQNGHDNPLKKEWW